MEKERENLGLGLMVGSQLVNFKLWFFKHDKEKKKKLSSPDGQLLNQCACMLGHVWLFLTPWTVAHHTPLSKEFSRQEHWSELPFPTPGDLPNPAIQPSPPGHCQADSLPLCHLENTLKSIKISKRNFSERRQPSPLSSYVVASFKWVPQQSKHM